MMRMLRAACWLGLVALALMVWSLLDPGWLQVIVAMSLGQVFGTLSLATFLLIVAVDLHLLRKKEKVGSAPPAAQ